MVEFMLAEPFMVTMPEPLRYKRHQ